MEGRVQDKKIQIQLRGSVPIEKEMLELIARHGPRSGITKILLMAGFEALYKNKQGGTLDTSSSQALPVVVTEKKKNSSFQNLAIKG